MTIMLGQKLGMTTIIDQKDRSIGVTIVKVGPNFIIALRSSDSSGTSDKNGKSLRRVQIGFGDVRSRLRTKALRKHMRRSNEVEHKIVPRKLIEIESDREYQLDQVIGAEEFHVRDTVKIQGISKGKGFQGGMKRHGFHGGRASHGSSFHRALGSTGAHTDPGKNYKGRKMPGQLGNQKVTVRNLIVQAVDVKSNLIFLLGAVPGARNGYVRIELVSSSLTSQEKS